MDGSWYLYVYGDSLYGGYTHLTGEYCGKKTCKTTNNNGPQNISK